jgi:hypothetical protein
MPDGSFRAAFAKKSLMAAHASAGTLLKGLLVSLLMISFLLRIEIIRPRRIHTTAANVFVCCPWPA